MRFPTQIPSPKIKLPSLPGRRGASTLVGLDIQPGFVAAVSARVNGSILAEHAVTLELPAEAVRDGEVNDGEALQGVLREMFSANDMSKHVRVGVANQRTVLRTLELPPLTDQKELAAAVSFQAQEQVPMPLSNAVLDFHPLGIIDTPAGPRQRVVLVAAQRDMVERLLAAVRGAGLSPEGVDLSGFALIRSLYRPGEEQTGRVLYLNVDGLTNLAIAEGPICRFTRVLGGGLEGMASDLAVRREIPISDARTLLARGDLSAPIGTDLELELEAATTPGQGDVKGVLERGIRDIAGELRNSLDFHSSQDDGGEVSHVVLSGSAQSIRGFAEALQASLGVEVRSAELGTVGDSLGAGIDPHRLAIATGLTVAEAPR